MTMKTSGNPPVGTGYELTKAFYNHLEQNEAMQIRCTAQHYSLYSWICELRNRVNSLNRSAPIEVLDLPREYSMKQAFIGSPTTFNRCVEDLVNWGIIEMVSKGRNQWSGARKIKLACSFLKKHCTRTKQAVNRRQTNTEPTVNQQQTGTEYAVNTTKTGITDTTGKTDNNKTNKINIEDNPPVDEIPKIAFRQNVRLQQAEYDTLSGLHGPVFTERCLDKLAGYKLAHGKSYRSDYGAILQWVVQAVRQEQTVAAAKQAAGPNLIAPRIIENRKIR